MSLSTGTCPVCKAPWKVTIATTGRNKVLCGKDACRVKWTNTPKSERYKMLAVVRGGQAA